MALKLAIAGLGAIGLKVARAVDAHRIPGITLAAIATRNAARAGALLEDFRRLPAIVRLTDLPDLADVIIECMPARHFRDAAEPALRAGRIFMPLSVGALIEHMDLVDIAAVSGGRIIVPSGAILGLDAVRAAAEGTIHAAQIVTRKPPASLAGAPLLAERGLSIDRLAEPLLLFSGSAREAIRGFPANINVAVAVALAGAGPDRTRVEVWADPTVSLNTHTVTVQSDSSNMTMTIENTPSAENPRTGTITGLSVIAALRRLTAPLVVGT